MGNLITGHRVGACKNLKVMNHAPVQQVMLCNGYPTVVSLYPWGVGIRTPSDIKTSRV